MKVRLAVILSFLILFSSVQEGITQISSVTFASGSCCTDRNTTDTDSTCDLDESQDSDSCCEGTSCDCTCCIHISLFNITLGSLAFEGVLAKDHHAYNDNYGLTIPFSIFHPPLS